MGYIDYLALRLDDGWPGAVFRTVLGMLIVPVWLAISPQPDSWAFVAFVLAVLFALRMGGAVMRRLLPVADGTREQWAARRQLGKQFDSYQWQKLLWLGCGTAIYSAAAAARFPALIAGSALCVAVGAAGAVLWRRQHARLIPVENGKGRA